MLREALATGMRRGEVFGLKSEDVDLSVPQIPVLRGLSDADGALRLRPTKIGRGRVLAIDQANADTLARQPTPTDPDCHACLLPDQGVPVKVVSERLGHRSIARTLNAQAHVLPAQDREAAHAIQRAMRGQLVG